MTVSQRGEFKQNAVYAILASLTTVLANLLLVSILPNSLGVESYGFLQLYLLYSSFVGLAHLGVVDGVYLDLGGSKLWSLNRPLITGVAVVLAGSQLILAVILWVLCGVFVSSPVVRLIWHAVAVCVFLTNVRFLLLYILQATASARAAAVCVVADRGAYAMLVAIAAVGGELSFETAILFDLTAKGLSLLVALFSCRRIFTRKMAGRDAIRGAVALYIGSGIWLLLANLASSFIIGSARLGIERRWSVREFAFVSLALGIALVGVSVIGSVGMALFPFLRRIREDRLALHFRNARAVLSPTLMLMLVAYVPVGFLISIGLPEYSNSVRYVGLILPIVVFEGLVVLLSGQMMRALRLERRLLFINAGSLALSIATTMVGTLVFGSIEAVLVGLVLTLAARSVAADGIVSNQLGLSRTWVVYAEVALAVGFMSEVIIGQAWDWPPVISSAMVVIFAAVALPKALSRWHG